MLEIDYELNIRRSRSISYYQRHQAYMDSLNSSDSARNHNLPASATGQIAGRSVTQTDTCSSERSSYHNYLISNVEDRLRSNYVNTVKKTNPYLLDPTSISLNSPV